MTTYSRKQFLQQLGTASIATASLGLIGTACDSAVKASDADRPNPSDTHTLTIGMASYSLRKFSLEEAISMTKRVGLEHICLKSMHLPLESRESDIQAAAKKVRDAGLDLYGAGVVYMKSEEAVHQAFAYAKAAGMRVIVGVPTHDLLPLVEQKVKESGILLAIHNHGPGDDLYSSPDDVWEKVENLDSRVGFCIDIGHVVRIQQDPVEKIRKYADRLYDIHFKDVDVAEAKGSSQEMGRGIIDIPAVVRALKEIKYQGIVALEFEKDGDDPLAGIAESVGFARGVMRVV
ncbi:MAG: sugar phosphate isomerase/epimerase [Bacteroidota bacterium]